MFPQRRHYRHREEGNTHDLKPDSNPLFSVLWYYWCGARQPDSSEIAGRAIGRCMITIMLVEDHHEIGRLMRTLFELEGYRVVATDSYEEILPLLSQTLPDVVFMDVRIDGRETIDLVRQMRQTDGILARIPIAMTSAWDCGPECLEAGANEFIQKPFLPDQVVQEVGSLSRQRPRVCQSREAEGSWPVAPIKRVFQY